MDDTPQIDDTQPPDYDALTTAALGALGDVLGIGGVMDWWVNNQARAHAVKTGVTYRSTDSTIKFVADKVKAIVEQTETAFGGLAASVVAFMFGSDAAGAFSTATSGGGNLADGAANVGAAVLQAIFGGDATDGAASIDPSAEPAERYIGAITEFVMRGWLIDMATEFVPFLQLHFVKDLEDTLISSLGLGRIARTALSPLVEITMTEPLRWKLNQTYRPKLATPSTAIRMWHRGQLDDAELDDILGRQGYGSDHIDGLKSEFSKFPSVGDLATLVEHGVMTTDEAVAQLQEDGYGFDSAVMVMQAAELRPLTAWQLRAAQTWMDRYVRGFISKSVFVQSLRSSGLSAAQAQEILNDAGAMTETPRTTLTVGELFVALDNQILTQGEVHDYLHRLGYSEDDSTTLLLTRLAIGKHKTEVEQQKKELQDQRAAAKLAAQQQRAAAQAAKAAAAAAARAARATQLAQQKAQAQANAEQRRQFIAAAAEQKRQLVAQQHAAGQITSDQLQLADAQIQADTAELLATATAHDAAEQASFEQQLLDLRQANREAQLEQQLADVDLALEPIAAIRQQGVALRLQNVDTLLTEKLADVDQLYTARQQTLDDNLAAELAAVDVRLLPTKDERAAAAAQKVAELDQTLQRKLTDIDAEYDDKQAAVDAELDAGTITQKAHDTKTDTITNGRAQAKRIAQQSHDLAVAAMQTSGSASDSLSVLDASSAKTKLQTTHDAAVKKLGDDKLAAQLAAQQAADKERLNLQVIQQQIGPITQAEAARRRLALSEQDAAAKKNEQVVALEIAKAFAAAADQAARAATTADAARKRLQALQSAVAAREAATTANNAATASLDASIERQRQDLERTIDLHSTPPTSSVPTPPAAPIRAIAPTVETPAPPTRFEI